MLIFINKFIFIQSWMVTREFWTSHFDSFLVFSYFSFKFCLVLKWNKISLANLVHFHIVRFDFDDANWIILRFKCDQSPINSRLFRYFFVAGFRPTGNSLRWLMVCVCGWNFQKRLFWKLKIFLCIISHQMVISEMNFRVLCSKMLNWQK